tara:strand:- start:59 stop:538 length:480 start_codon:yes stop_codon:yes gene_type:complete
MTGKRDLSTAREWGREILKTHELQAYDSSSQDAVLPVLDTTEIQADAQPRKMSISGIMNTAIAAGIVSPAGSGSAPFNGELSFAGGITLDNTVSGVYTLRGAGSNDAALVLNCSVNTHGVTIQAPPHSAGATYIIVLPENQGAAGQALRNDGSGNLYWG